MINILGSKTGYNLGVFPLQNLFSGVILRIRLFFTIMESGGPYPPDKVEYPPLGDFWGSAGHRILL